MTLKENETSEQIADRMNKAFVIHSYELLLQRMLPAHPAEKLLELSETAEKAMTVTPYMGTNETLRKLVYESFPDAIKAKIVHETICSFASNIMGVLVNKSQEVVNGTYTPENFFEIPS